MFFFSIGTRLSPRYGFVTGGAEACGGAGWVAFIVSWSHPFILPELPHPIVDACQGRSGPPSSLCRPTYTNMSGYTAGAGKAICGRLSRDVLHATQFSPRFMQHTHAWIPFRAMLTLLALAQAYL